MTSSTTTITMQRHGADAEPFAVDSSTLLSGLGAALHAAGFTVTLAPDAIEVRIGEGATFALVDLVASAGDRTHDELGHMTLFYSADVPPPVTIKVFIQGAAAPLGTVGCCQLLP